MDKILILLVTLACGGTAVAQDTGSRGKTRVRQTARSAQQIEDQVHRAQERARRGEERERRRAEKLEEAEQTRQKGTEVRLKLERGGRLVINNWSGEITVTGVDGDQLEARATDEDSDELVPLEYRVTGLNIFLGGDAGKSFHKGGTANISVKVPRYAAAVEVDVLSGDITVSNLDGAVKTNAVSGSVIIQCVKGGVNAKSVSGSIELRGIAGDVVSETVSGSIEYSGLIRQGGSYRLKSMSGEVEMQVQSEAPGFTATLTTFSGEIETAFPLKIEKSSQFGGTNRQIVGRYGDGAATLSLNSFSGSARIIKATARAVNCN